MTKSFRPVSRHAEGGLLLAFMATLAFGVSGCAGVRTRDPEPNARRGLFSELFDRSPSSQNGATHKQSVANSREPAPAGAVEVTEISAHTRQVAQKLELHWPLRHVQVTSRFGRRPRDFHEGIDLRAKSGTPVFAAQAGVVLYAGKKIRGYGRMLVIKHAYGIATVYAHNSRLLVHAGQHVRLGEQVAYSGSTGHSTGPHLHFEVRSGTLAVDPQQMIRPELVASRAPLSPSRDRASRLASNH